MNWVVRQPWFDGNLALWGGSYLGNTAWAIAHSPAAAKVKAMSLHVTLTNFHDRTMVRRVHLGGGHRLDHHDGRGLAEHPNERVWHAHAHAPEPDAGREGDGCFTAEESRSDGFPGGRPLVAGLDEPRQPGDAYWNPINYGRAAETMPATLMSGGWYDIFLPWQVKDFMTAQRAGRDARLLIGPWMHADMGGASESFRETIAMFQEQFGLIASRPAQPRVRLLLMGANEWRDYPSWPVPNAAAQNYFLNERGTLSRGVPSAAGASAFDYDPARPTPSLHGPTIEGKSGSGDMAALERRSTCSFSPGALA